MSGTTPWHITWGTYGTRLHGGARPTVDHEHNQRGDAFVEFDPPRYERNRHRMRFPPVVLTDDQRRFIQDTIPQLCHRGGWQLVVCAAGPDHVHVFAAIRSDVHGEKVRRLLKRWLTQAMNDRWVPGSGRPGSLPAADASWWAEQGSNRPVTTDSYRRNVVAYIHDQRAQRAGPSRPRPCLRAR